MILSIVIPVYDEESTLPYSHGRLTLALLPYCAAEKIRLELIYVDDGSKDQSSSIISSLVEESRKNSSDMEVRILRFSRNFGHSAAVIAGIDQAKGDWIAIVDADLQDPPEILPDMLREIKKGWDVVYGQRTARLGEGAFKRVTAWLFYRLLKGATGIEIPVDAGDFRVMTREVADALRSCKEREPFLRGLVAWVGFRQKSFPYRREERKFGDSKYPFRRMFRLAISAIVSFSTVPLWLATAFGFLGLLMGVFLTIWSIHARMQGITVPGWTSLLLGFTFGNSVTLIILGAIGLYVGRVHGQTQDRPRYIIRTENRS